MAFVPEDYEFSGDPKKKLGEEAEKKVFDKVGQGGRDIPGIQIVCFHGVRVIAGFPIILREADFCLFITYQGRYYIVIKEVKCNANPERSRGTSKKAITQLKTFKDMLASELNVQTKNIHFHAVWPNMPETEPCPSCQGCHPSLYERPAACQQAGTQRRANPEPVGFHVFKDKLEDGKFSKWMKGIINDPTTAVDLSTYDTVLDFVARHCIGVLYDEIMKSFCILGNDQENLVSRREMPLDKPTVVYGLAGTGKTISIMSRIERVSVNLNLSSRALYICFEDNVIAMVKRKLEACQVDLTHVDFANHKTFSHDLSDITRDGKVIQDLTGLGYRYIYVDSAEDFGVDWVNKLLETALVPDKDSMDQIPLENQVCGDFWVMVDPYQALGDSHCLMEGFNNQVHWQGPSVRSDLLEEGLKKRFVKLNECFRMPKALIDHIKTQKILPTNDLPKAQDAESRGTMVEDIKLSEGSPFRGLAEQLAGQLQRKVMRSGIHPGHCAVVYDPGAEDVLFPPDQGGVDAFCQLVNSTLRAIPAKSQATHMVQLTQDMEGSLWYGSRSTEITSSLSVSPPMTVSPRLNALVGGNETVEYIMETHFEVIL